MTAYRVLLLPGDGIGPEITDGTAKVLAAAAELEELDLELRDWIYGAAYDATGQPFPDETKEQAKNADAILLGAVGGPRYDHLPPALRPRNRRHLALRKSLCLYATCPT